MHKKIKKSAVCCRVVCRLSLLLLFCVLCGCGQDEVEYVISDETVTESTLSETSSSEGDSSDSADEDGSLSSETAGSSNADDSENAAGSSDLDAAQASSDDAGETADTANAASSGQTIFVYVCGEVYAPGVYELPEGSRVYEALAAAGGLTGNAETRSLNQAQVLQDGQQITVYTAEELEDGTAAQLEQQSSLTVTAADGTSTGTTGTGETAKVNLNTATQEELMTLPGIGEAKATAIISYRETNGKFSSIEEIQNISGIKTKAFEKIKDLIEV